MTFKVIQYQGQCHGPVKFAKLADFEVSKFAKLADFFSAICCDILDIRDDYGTMGQFLNFVWSDFTLSLSFLFMEPNLIQNASKLVMKRTGQRDSVWGRFTTKSKYLLSRYSTPTDLNR